MPNLFLSNVLIEQVTSYKYLGVLVLSDLKWNEHIIKVSQRSSELLGFLYTNFYRHVGSLLLL